jgi:molybdate/tungstate transport system substrate-binding protein
MAPRKREPREAFWLADDSTSGWDFRDIMGSEAIVGSPDSSVRVDEPRVSVLNAGAVGNFVANGLAPALRRERGIVVHNESGPSVGLANTIRAGDKTADVYMSADAEVNAGLMGSPNGNLISWYVVFAGNSVVLVHSPRSRYLAYFKKAADGEIPWYEVLRRPGVRLVRGDPNQDPLAYYTLLVMDLAERHYGIPGLKRDVLGDDVNPDQLTGFSFAGIENGDVDAIFMYRSLALDRQYPFVVLPNEVNLSEPSLADRYSRVSFTTNKGQTFRGVPIRFSAAILANAVNPDQAVELVTYLVSPAGQRLIADYNFLPSDVQVHGDIASVPDQIQSLLAELG